MTLTPTRLVGGWVVCEDGPAAIGAPIAYTVTGTSTITRQSPSSFTTRTHYHARPVWFPTKREAQAWIEGKRTDTQAPALASVVWAIDERAAVQAFLDEYEEAPEYKRQ